MLKATRRRHSNRGLTILTVVLLGLLAVLACRELGLTRHPSSSAAHRVHARDASQRLAAVHDLERFGPEDPGVAIPALIASLRDPDAQVRAAGSMALVTVLHGGGKSSAGTADLEQAVSSLFRLRNESQADVRAAGIQALWMIAFLGNDSAPVVDLSTLEDALITAASDPDAMVRIAAVRGLGAIGPKLAEYPPPVLPSALEDESEKVRVAAAEALLRFQKGLPGMLPSLVRAFERARPEVRAGYAAVLERVRPRLFTAQAVPALASALSSLDDEVRCLAAMSLAAYGSQAQSAVPALVAGMTRAGRAESPAPALANERDPVLAAARALLRILPEDPRDSTSPPSIDGTSFLVLTNVLRSGTPPVRATVAAALGRFRPTPAVIPVLGAAAGDPDAAVRAAALQALDGVGDRMPFVPPKSVAAALDDVSPQVRYWAAGALGHARRGIDPFVAGLLHHAEHDPDAEVRAVCVRELQDFLKPPAVTPSLVPILIEALERPDPQVRCAAARLLARFGPDSAPAVPAIIRRLTKVAGRRDASGNSSTSDDLPWAAAALGEIAPGTPQAEPAAKALLTLLQSDMSPSATRAVIESLSRFGPLARRGLRRLRELEELPDPVIRKSAHQAMENIHATD